MCCCNEDKQAESHVKNVAMIVSRGLGRETDSVNAVGLREVGGEDEEIAARIETDGERFHGPVGCVPYTSEAASIPVIPTKWVDEGGAKQLEYYTRLCEKEFERLSSNVKCV